MARGLRKLVRTDESDYADSDVVPLNPVGTAPQSVGELLQTKRAEFGAELREAADYLNIRYAYLLAIEEGRVDDLPGAAYAMGFVRAYADYLGLDGPAIVERYKAETSELGDDVRLVFPSPLPEGKIPSAAIILVGLVALLLVYGGWVVFAQKDVKIAELVPALPKQFASLLGSDEPAVDPVQTPSDTVATAPATPIVAVAPPETETPIQAPGVPPETRSDPTDTATVSASDPPASSVATDTPVAPVATEPASEPTATETAESAAASDETVSAVEAATAKAVENAAQTVPVTEAVTPPETAAVATETVDANSAGTESVATETVSAAIPPVGAAEAVPTVPSNTAQSTPPATEQVETPSETPADTAEPAAIQAEPAAVQESQDAAILPPKPPAVASAEPRQYGSENAVSRVTIKARIDSWVQIRDQEGDKLLTRVLRAGDSYRVPDRPGLLMETGNAGGLEITVDGSVIPDIGPKGAVRREIALEAESLKAGGAR